MSQELVSLASFNTLHLEGITSGEALNYMSGVDVVLLQEVTHSGEALAKALDNNDFDVVQIAENVGLAMAVRRSSNITYQEGSALIHILQPLSWHERSLAAMHIKQENDFSHRGMLAAKFITAAGVEFTVANVHPAAPINWIRRRRQIGMIGLELANPDYDGKLIIGGDWNHWPSPERADIAMWESIGLRPVELGTTATWQARGFEQKLHVTGLSIFRRRLPNGYAAHLDNILYRDMEPLGGSVRKVDGSDHAIVFVQLGIGG